MSAKIFTYDVIIKENYLDIFGHVNNAAYLVLFEEARWDLITKNGYGVQKIEESGLGPTILELKLSFLREIRLREEIQIMTQMISYEKKIGKLFQSMKRGEKVCCTGEFTIGLFNMKERKLVSPTSEWLAAIGIE